MNDVYKELKTTEESSFFEETKNTKNTLDISNEKELWVVAEADLVNPQLWVESKFGNGERFDSLAECNRFIRLNPKIDNLIKVGLRAKKISELKP